MRGAESSWRTGQRFGRYTLISALGRGAYGSVFLAHDPQVGREVAIKILVKEGERALARFERELRATARLRHPGIVSVHDSGVAAGRPYLVMEYVNGDSFAALCEGSRKVATSRAVELIRDAALAIQAAHDAGVLHRDIKPQNLMLDADGAVRVLDFGLASLRELSRERLSREGQPLGTPAYMAPEQLSGKTVDERADVYGLGSTLFHLLAGASPLEGEEHPMIALAKPEPPSVAERNPDVSPRLDALCAKCMARDPNGRFASAVELAEALDAFLRGPEREAPARWGVPALIVGCGVAVAGVVLALGLRTSEQSPAKPVSVGVDAAPANDATTPAGEPQTSAAVGRVASPRASEDEARELLRQALSSARLRARSSDVVARFDQALAQAKGNVDLESEIGVARAWHLLARARYAEASRAARSLTDLDGERGLEARLLHGMALVLNDDDPPPYARDWFESLARDDRGGLYGLTASATLVGYLDEDWEGASDIAHQALRIDPDFVPAAMARALGLMNTGHERESMDLLERIAGELAPDLVRAHLGMTVGYLNLANVSLAVETLTLAERLAAPKEVALAVFIRGQVAAMRGEFDRAVGLLQRSLALRPRNCPAWFMLGMCQSSLQRDAEAAEAFRRAMAISPTQVRKIVGSCRPYALQAHIRRLLEIPFPGTEVTPEQKRGVSTLLIGVPEAARAQLDEALRFAAQGFAARAWRGAADKARDLAPDSARVALVRARLFTSRDLYEDASAEIERARGLSGATHSLALLEAFVAWRRGDVPQSLVCFDALASGDPDGSAGLAARALAAVLRGVADLEAVEGAVRIAPDDIDVLNAAAYAQATVGSPTRAREHASRALERYGHVATLAALTRAGLIFGAARVDDGFDTSRVDEALMALEVVLAATDGATPRLTGARMTLQLDARSPWFRSGAEWLREVEAREPERAALPLLKGAYALRERAATRAQVVRHWREARARDPNMQIPADFLDAFKTRFGDALGPSELR